MLLIGKFLATHGVDGGIKIISYCENPEDIFSMKLFLENKQQISCVKKCNTSKIDTFVAYVNDIKNIEDVEKFKNKEIYSSEDELKENEETVYLEDLMNMKVVADGKTGTVVNIYNYGAGDSIEIKWQNGETETIPITEQYVKSIDKPNHTIFIEEPTYI